MVHPRGMLSPTNEDKKHWGGANVPALHSIILIELHFDYLDQNASLYSIILIELHFDYLDQNASIALKAFTRVRGGTPWILPGAPFLS